MKWMIVSVADFDQEHQCVCVCVNQTSHQSSNNDITHGHGGDQGQCAVFFAEKSVHEEIAIKRVAVQTHAAENSGGVSELW